MRGMNLINLMDVLGYDEKWWYEELDRIASTVLQRHWSPVRTEECPIEDRLRGGYCESDEQLRTRIKVGVR